MSVEKEGKVINILRLREIIGEMTFLIEVEFFGRVISFGGNDDFDIC